MVAKIISQTLSVDKTSQKPDGSNVVMGKPKPTVPPTTEKKGEEKFGSKDNMLTLGV